MADLCVVAHKLDAPSGVAGSRARVARLDTHWFCAMAWLGPEWGRARTPPTRVWMGEGGRVVLQHVHRTSRFPGSWGGIRWLGSFLADSSP